VNRLLRLLKKQVSLLNTHKWPVLSFLFSSFLSVSYLRISLPMYHILGKSSLAYEVPFAILTHVALLGFFSIVLSHLYQHMNLHLIGTTRDL
jgi:hypothetical protein